MAQCMESLLAETPLVDPVTKEVLSHDREFLRHRDMPHLPIRHVEERESKEKPTTTDREETDSMRNIHVPNATLADPKMIPVGKLVSIDRTAPDPQQPIYILPQASRLNPGYTSYITA